MSHIRQQIRDSVVRRLTGLTTTGSNIFETRFYPLEQTGLPGLLVYGGDTTAEPTTMGDNQLMVAQQEIIVQAVVEGMGSDDTLDTIISEIEVALGNTDLSGIVKRLSLEGIEVSEDAEGEKPIIAASMTYMAEYHYRQNDPETAL